MTSELHAGTDGPRVILVGVDGSPTSLRDAAAQVDAELRRELGPAAERLGIEVEYRSVRGDPVAALSRIADELPADAVLVGASEQAGHRVIGSVAVRLVRMGRWPVTVVP